ncbi:phospholipase D family protein [Pseudogracilibacillus sp. SE30717A]|uniref:phospholipase D family protein n=1 Tax=Pseudogracilibacillus sp. SE30717A TaxID=3098293 RepID=UPI00300DF8BB
MKNHKRKYLIALLLFIVILILVIFYNTNKSLPERISYEGETHYVDDVEFLYNLTYQDENGITIYEQEIFSEIEKIIGEAEDVIVVDMFLFNNYTDQDRDFPKLSSNLTNALITQKEKHPNIQIIFITDPVNTGYHSYENELLEKLKENGIDVVVTSLNELRDSNPLYSGIWRIFFQMFGQEGKGWLPNPISSDAPKVTLRSYLLLFNVKANHRKVVATEKAAIITSANAHDESGFFSNTAFKVRGNIINDIFESEQAVIDYTTKEHPINIRKRKDSKEKKEGNIAIKYLTEGKIYEHILQNINQTKQGDEIWLSMFYIADKKVIDALVVAADRGVQVNMILDANKIAFGHTKAGLPNLPTSSEMITHDNIQIRWYDSAEEQYHPKMIYIKDEKDGIIIGGSANYTQRNLDDLNLENDIKIVSSLDEQVMKDMDAYFQRMWNNEDGIFTAEYEKYQDTLTPARKLTYWVQKLTGLTTY